VDTPSEPEIQESSFPESPLRKSHQRSAHLDLQKTFYALCFPSVIIGLNAAIFLMAHGQVVWPTPEDTSAAWASDTYAGAWISITTNLAATVLFVFFSRHKRLRRYPKIAMSLMLSLAWLCSAISFLAID
jgi:hypothetical protein